MSCVKNMICTLQVITIHMHTSIKKISVFKIFVNPVEYFSWVQLTQTFTHNFTKSVNETRCWYAPRFLHFVLVLIQYSQHHRWPLNEGIPPYVSFPCAQHETSRQNQETERTALTHKRTQIIYNIFTDKENKQKKLNCTQCVTYKGPASPLCAWR